MQGNEPLMAATSLIQRCRSGDMRAPVVRAFFHEPTNTASYVIHDPGTKAAAIIDSVLDFDAAAGRTGRSAADQMIAYVKKEGLTVEWLLETHAHADHISAAPYLQKCLGGKLAIGHDIVVVQNVFGKIFNEGSDFRRDGSQFDRLFADGDRFSVGGIRAVALHVPGHTSADLAYVVGDAVFAGDTLFMPDSGTARADFPGGDARQLYHSVRRLMDLPRETRVFLCHDYKAPGRDTFMWETTIGEQRDSNIHIHEGVAEDEFVAMRTRRDAMLPVPKLILPSIQVNIRGGHLPAAEANGTCYLKLPLDAL